LGWRAHYPGGFPIMAKHAPKGSPPTERTEAQRAASRRGRAKAIGFVLLDKNYRDRLCWLPGSDLPALTTPGKFA
jgi:hypothetical protein